MIRENLRVNSHIIFLYDKMDPLFLFFLMALVSENLVMIKLGTYPYLYGFPVHRVTINVNNLDCFVSSASWKLSTIKTVSGDIYLRYSYAPLFWAPYIFSGHIKRSDQSSLIVRIAPLSGIFFIGYAVFSFYHSVLSGLFSLLVIYFFVWYTLRNLLKNVTKAIEKHGREEK